MSDVIIKTQDLVKKYHEVTAVDHLNLEINRGEIFGLLGPNGAGKTTTTLMLLGLTEPTEGYAYIDGHDCTRDALAVKKEVGYLPDNVGFYPDMTGRQNLVFSGQMNGLTEKEANERAATLLERVGMTFAADRKTNTYSRGMRQRLGIADVLIKDPKVIIMDEPTLGIDPSGMRELTALIRRLSVEDGRTILISSHELYQIQEISDRIGIFVEGRMIACGRMDELGAQVSGDGIFLLDVKAKKESHADFDRDNERLKLLIDRIPGIISNELRPDGTFHIESDRNINSALLTILVENGYVLREMHERGGDLDEIYRKYFEKEGEKNGNASDTTSKEKHGIKEKFGKLLDPLQFRKQ